MRENYNLSLSVLVDHPLFEGVTDPMDEMHKNKVRAALYAHGMDIDKKVHTIIKTHRNIFNKLIENGILFIGTERSDHRWLSLKIYAATPKY